MGAAIGGAVMDRGWNFEAMDQLAKPIMATARTGMPCLVAEKANRFMSGDLRELAKRRGLDRPDSAVLHGGDAVGEAVDAAVMRDDDDRAVGRKSRLLEDLEHGLAGFGVERGGGLIAHDETRRVNNGASDRSRIGSIAPRRESGR